MFIKFDRGQNIFQTIPCFSKTNVNFFNGCGKPKRLEPGKC